MIFTSGTTPRFHRYLNISGRRSLRFLLAAMIGAFVPLNAQGQAKSRTDPPRILTGTISMPNVEGRIDHFAIDPGGRLFVCVVGNDTVEILKTLTDKRIPTIAAVPHPQGAVYAPELRKLFVGSRDGKLYVYDRTSFDLIKSVT